MSSAGKFLWGAAALALAACAGQPGELTIRPKGTPLAAALPVASRIAEGHAQLALGNAGLSLELFRKALREDPASAQANAGIALSYDQMNRFDLSRRYFEAALALAPADSRILGQLAASLDRQGARGDAANVRREIAKRREQAMAASATVVMKATAVAGLRPAASLAAPAPRPEPDAAKPPLAVLAPAKSVSTLARVPFASPARLASTPVPAPARHGVAMSGPPKTRVPAAAPVAALTPVPDPARAVATAATPARRAPADLAFPLAPAAESSMAARSAPVIAPHALAAKVTVSLPPARPAAAPSASVKAQPDAVGEPMSAVDEHAPIRAPSPPSPRLERMSATEVALVTQGVVQWRPQVVAKTARATTIRFVPLKTRGSAVASVQLLNAARHRGLASRTRAYLAAKGWRRLVIGDALRTRETSIIYYPQSRRRTAEVLAAQFRIRVTRRVHEGNAIVMLLGRDAVPARAGGKSA